MLTTYRKKSTGPDKISARMLKVFSTSCSPTNDLRYLTYFSKQALSLKCAKIVPIHKERRSIIARILLSDFYPSLLSKLLKNSFFNLHIVSNYLNIHYPISDKQWCFNHHRHRVFHTRLFTSIPNKAEVFSVLIDISKAF